MDFCDLGGFDGMDGCFLDTLEQAGNQSTVVTSVPHFSSNSLPVAPVAPSPLTKSSSFHGDANEIGAALVAKTADTARVADLLKVVVAADGAINPITPRDSPTAPPQQSSAGTQIPAVSTNSALGNGSDGGSGPVPRIAGFNTALPGIGDNNSSKERADRRPGRPGERVERSSAEVGGPGILSPQKDVLGMGVSTPRRAVGSAGEGRGTPRMVCAAPSAEQEEAARLVLENEFGGTEVDEEDLVFAWNLLSKGAGGLNAPPSVDMTPDDLRAGIGRIWPNVSDREVRRLVTNLAKKDVELIDAQGQVLSARPGSLSRAALTASLLENEVPVENRDLLAEAFRVLDPFDTGVIWPEAIGALLTTFGWGPMDADDLEALTEIADADGDGLIGLKDFAMLPETINQRSHNELLRRTGTFD